MLELNQLNCDFKIASPDSISVVGSNSVNTSGELYQVQLNLINSEENQRNKRMFDILAALFLIILSPIFWILQKEKSAYFKNLFSVFSNRISFVGYDNTQDKSIHLKEIKQGILSPINNINYAKNYSVLKDITIVYQQIREIGKHLKK